jgi:solute carrier family 44 protein 1 (choline transporter-like protein)
LRFGTANSIGFIFSVLGVAFIGAMNGLIAYSMLHYVPAYKGMAHNWLAPCVVAVAEGVIIGSMFMSVFSFASDTILQSFMVDEELKRPDGNRPAIMNDLIEGMDAGKSKEEEKKE